jgi:hypothetical protein
VREGMAAGNRFFGEDFNEVSLFVELVRSIIT